MNYSRALNLYVVNRSLHRLSSLCRITKALLAAICGAASPRSNKARATAAISYYEDQHILFGVSAFHANAMRCCCLIGSGRLLVDGQAPVTGDRLRRNRRVLAMTQMENRLNRGGEECS